MKFNYFSLFIVLSILFQSCSKDETPDEPKEDDIPVEMENSAPDSFNLISLENDTENTELIISLAWETASDKDEDSIVYDVFLDTSENLENKVATAITATEFTIITPLEKQTVYYWKVIAKDGNGGETASTSTFKFTTRSTEASDAALIENAAFSKRSKHTTVEFQGKLWLIGGSDDTSLLKDVWSSEDGENWSLEAENPFGIFVKSGHTSVVFKDKLWVIGGFFSDVWSSSNGVDWTNETSSAEFGPRENHTSLVYDGKIWVIGGSDSSSNHLNDVWSSEDGVTWTEVASSTQFTPRIDHTSVVFNDKMYVIGGNTVLNFSPVYYNDIYSSTNGIDWIQEDTNTIFEVRSAHTTVIYENQLWVIGGWQAITNDNTGEQDVVSFNDAWYSENGTDWVQVPGDMSFAGRLNHSTVSFNDKIYVIGGNNIQNNPSSQELFNDVWTIE